MQSICSTNLACQFARLFALHGLLAMTPKTDTNNIFQRLMRSFYCVMSHISRQTKEKDEEEEGKKTFRAHAERRARTIDHRKIGRAKMIAVYVSSVSSVVL